MKRQLTLLLTILFMSFAAAMAQHKTSNEFMMGPDEFKKKYQEFIIKQAELTKEEAAKFFPIYDECQKKKEKLNSQIWELRRDVRNKELAEKEYQHILEETAKLRIQIAEIDKTYLQLYRKVLPYKKIFKVQVAESRFHRELLRGVNHQKKHKERK